MTEFTGERWTQNRGQPGKHWPALARSNGLRVIRSIGRAGNWHEPDNTIHGGGNSGFMAVSLACISRASRVLLLGFDMGPNGAKRHFFGDHPGRMNKPSPYDKFISNFDDFAPQAEAHGVEIINCTQRTALRCFNRQSLASCLSTSETLQQRGQ